MSISIKPLEDRIVIRQVEAEQTTASGLVIPDTAKEKPQEGEVIAVGPGRVDDKGNRIPVDVKVGDVVIYSRYGGTEVKYEGQEFQILSSRDVLAVVERGAPSHTERYGGGPEGILPGRPRLRMTGRARRGPRRPQSQDAVSASCASTVLRT